MDLSSVLDVAHCVIGARYATKAACLGELAKRAAAAVGLDKTLIADALARREALGSTGLGHGIALPHARISDLTSPFVLIQHLREPIAFEAIDDQPVDIVCLILVPAVGDTTALLATLSRRLRDAEVRAAIRKASSPQLLRYAIVGG